MFAWWFKTDALRQSLRRMWAVPLRVAKWWLRALERRPFAGILALGVCAVGAGVALRVAVPREALVISAFEVPEAAATPQLGVSGKTMANVFLDAIQRVLDTATIFTTALDSSSAATGTYDELLTFAIRAEARQRRAEVGGKTVFQPSSGAFRLGLAPLAKAPSVGVEVEGLSVERIAAEWNRVRERQTIVSGDVLTTATGLSLRARISGKGVWEVGPVAPTLADLDRAASELALHLFTGTNPSIAQRYYLSRGLRFQRRGSLVDALRSYRRAAAIATEDPCADLFLGVALLQVGKADSAVATLRRAIFRNPHDADLQFFIGTILQRGGQLHEAIRVLAGVLKIQPSLSGAQFNLALAYSDQGMIPEAKAAWLTYLRHHHDDGDAWNGVAWMYYQRGALSDASVYSDSSIKLGGARGQQSYLDTRANILLDSGNPEKALETWDQAAAASSEPAAYVEIGRAMASLDLGRTAEAIAAYKRGIVLDPRYGDRRYLRAGAGYSAKALARLGRLRLIASVARSRKHSSCLQVDPGMPSRLPLV
jgi:tetratricopeptide (TPR) repeat protein